MYDIIKDFFENLQIKFPYLKPYLAEYQFWLPLLALAIYLFLHLVRLSKQALKKTISFIYQKDLHPYFTVKQVFKSTNSFIQTNFQNISPSQEEEPSRNFASSAKNRLIPLFLNHLFQYNGDENKYYLVLADSGMGKTTFMINLFLRYKQKKSFFKRKFDIVLLPLGSQNIWKDIEQIPDEKKPNTILLLDAFDEDSEAIIDYNKRMKFILSKVWRFREVVITCRTQFFPTSDDEIAGYTFFSDGSGHTYKFQRLYISFFSHSDISQYLRKKYTIINPLNWRKLSKAYTIVEKCPSLMMRPMLLSYIDDFINSKGSISNLNDIYSLLVNKWIERESNKAGIVEKYQHPNTYKRLLYNFSTNFAKDIYLNNKSRGGFFMNYKDFFSPIDSLSIKDINQEYIDSLDQQSRSLLSRDAFGNYKFSHKSIFEYFLFKNLISEDYLKLVDHITFDGFETLRQFLINHIYTYHSNSLDVDPESSYESLTYTSFKSQYNIVSSSIKAILEDNITIPLDVRHFRLVKNITIDMSINVKKINELEFDKTTKEMTNALFFVKMLKAFPNLKNVTIINFSNIPFFENKHLKGNELEKYISYLKKITSEIFKISPSNNTEYISGQELLTQYEFVKYYKNYNISIIQGEFENELFGRQKP